MSGLTEWLSSDGLATWLSLLISVGAGSFVGASAAARERMRLEDRRLLYDRFLPAISTVAAETDRTKLDSELAAYSFLDEDEVRPLIKSALLAVRGVEATDRIVPLLSWPERAMWAQAIEDLDIATELHVAFGFLSMRIEAQERLPQGFAAPTDDFTFAQADLIDLEPLHHPYGLALTEFDGIPAIERFRELLGAKLNPRLSNFWLRRTATVRTAARTVTRFTTRNTSADTGAAQWEYALKWSDSG